MLHTHTTPTPHPQHAGTGLIVSLLQLMLHTHTLTACRYRPDRLTTPAHVTHTPSQHTGTGQIVSLLQLMLHIHPHSIQVQARSSHYSSSCYTYTLTACRYRPDRLTTPAHVTHTHHPHPPPPACRYRPDRLTTPAHVTPSPPHTQLTGLPNAAYWKEGRKCFI